MGHCPIAAPAHRLGVHARTPTKVDLKLVEFPVGKLKGPLTYRGESQLMDGFRGQREIAGKPGVQDHLNGPGPTFAVP